MADVALGSNNPFRTPNATPTPTGTAPATPPRPSNPPSSAPPASADLLGLTEDEPPAYTMRPDVRQGESTLEFGPARPFQQAPPPLHSQQSNGGGGPGWTTSQRQQQQQQQPQSLLRQLTGHIAAQLTGALASTGTYPGQQAQRQYAPPPRPPPPQQPYAPPLQPSPAAASPASAPHMSEFARDFYAATQVPPGMLSNELDVPSPEVRASSAPPPSTLYPPPPVPPPSTQYQPPSGAPPPGPAGIPDDGRPTTTPVPGHPLLKDGMMLVYPPHYECHKCHNTGYRHADPSHPCARCWHKYARAYAGALRVAPYSPSTPGASTFQRPLPRLYGPTSSPSPTWSQPPGAAAHTRAHSDVGPGYAPPPGPPPPSQSQSRFPPPPQHPAIRLSPPGAYPPPATVYAPGDIRLGGSPCWRCGGRGSVSFLVVDSVTCAVCRGVGRVYG